jgi:hypothetical protein
LHSRGRHAWQPASPRQTTGLAPRRSCRNQAGLVFRPPGLFTFSFFGGAMRRSRNRFPTRRGGFCMPGTGGAITGATDAVPVPSTGTATEVGPLTSSPPSRGQSSGRALWTPADTPGDGQTSWVDSSNPVLHPYISCYVTVNKPVLSYLLMRLLPHKGLLPSISIPLLSLSPLSLSAIFLHLLFVNNFFPSIYYPHHLLSLLLLSLLSITPLFHAGAPHSLRPP